MHDNPEHGRPAGVPPVEPGKPEVPGKPPGVPPVEPPRREIKPGRPFGG